MAYFIKSVKQVKLVVHLVESKTSYNLYPRQVQVREMLHESLSGEFHIWVIPLFMDSVLKLLNYRGRQVHLKHTAEHN